MPISLYRPYPTHGHSYYMCRCAVQPIYSQHDQRCEARYSPADQLDALVWQDLCDLLAQPEWIAHALARAYGGHWLPQELQSRRDAFHKAYVNLSNQLDRLTEAYLQEVIPLAEYQRRRRDLEQKQQGLQTQPLQLEAHVDRQSEIAGMVTSIEAFCQRVRISLAKATFEQKRTLVELLIDRVLVAHGDVEIRYAIPTAPRGETSRFCQLRKDYFNHPACGILQCTFARLCEVGHFGITQQEPFQPVCRVWGGDFPDTHGSAWDGELAAPPLSWTPGST